MAKDLPDEITYHHSDPEDDQVYPDCSGTGPAKHWLPSYSAGGNDERLTRVIQKMPDLP